MSNSAEWRPELERGGTPLYLEIANRIEADVKAGALLPGARLPAQRDLARRLGIDFTTVTRAYAEAKNRGLVVGRAGQGTFVAERAGAAPFSAERSRLVDMSMNAPPRPDDPALEALLRRGLTDMAGRLDMGRLMTYGPNAGEEEDRQAGRQWLSSRLPHLDADRLILTPGTQGALLVVLLMLAASGEAVCTEELTYPGMKALCAQLGVRLIGLPMDAEGLDPDAFRAVCRSTRPKALYCTPTLHNPTTATLSFERRQAIAAIAREYGVPIIEDDAYGRLPAEPLPPLAAFAPDMTYLVGGVAKTIAPALRLAYLVSPDARQAQRAVSVQRATTLMASPIAAALASQWIVQGTAERLLAAIRSEAKARQALAQELLPAGSFASQPEAFHVWLGLQTPWSPGEFLAQLAVRQIRAAGTESFAVGQAVPAGVRICLGNLPSRELTRQALSGIAGLLRDAPDHSLIV